MNTLGPYEIHPAADVFPLIEGDEFKALTADIERHGLREPIVLAHDGKTLVDGRNRYRACLEASVDPVFHRLDEAYQGAALVEYIVSINVKRRHLNAGQLSFVAAALEPIYAELAKERQGERTDLKVKPNIPADLQESKGGRRRREASE
jgi:ParB-like chromosome segregation protein Spo0J